VKMWCNKPDTHNQLLTRSHHEYHHAAEVAKRDMKSSLQAPGTHLGHSSAPRPNTSRAPPALPHCLYRISPHARYTYGLRGLAPAARANSCSACGFASIPCWTCIAFYLKRPSQFPVSSSSRVARPGRPGVVDDQCMWTMQQLQRTVNTASEVTLLTSPCSRHSGTAPAGGAAAALQQRANCTAGRGLVCRRPQRYSGAAPAGSCCGGAPAARRPARCAHHWGLPPRLVQTGPPLPANVENALRMRSDMLVKMLWCCKPPGESWTKVWWRCSVAAQPDPLGVAAPLGARPQNEAAGASHYLRLYALHGSRDNSTIIM